MMYILSKFEIIVLMLERIFVNETVLRIRKFNFWAKNGLNLKLSLFFFLLSIQYL